MSDEKVRVAVFDIDGTLANMSHRLPHLFKRKKDWDAFFAGCPDDEPIAPMIALAGMVFDSQTWVLLLTGRNEDLREVTQEWLWKHDVSYDVLLMRDVNDHRADDIVKPEVLERYLSEKGLTLDNVLFVVEDRSRVVSAWRKKGVICLQCADGDF